MATDPVTPPEPKPAPKPRSPQDKKLANDLSLVEQMLRAAQTDEEAAPGLAEGGYTLDELKAGVTLQKAAMQAFIARQEADGQQIAATRAFAAADKAARTTYTKLRGFARSAFMNDAAAREALGLNGREPKDQQNFITATNALLEQGKIEPYAAKLAKKTVTPAKLADFAVKMEAWKVADQNQTDALSDVPDATARRDAAAKALFEWVAEYRQFTRTQFKDQPGIIKRLLL
jgi:hypothetical protein